jgi:hypothetical protein
MASIKPDFHVHFGDPVLTELGDGRLHRADGREVTGLACSAAHVNRRTDADASATTVAILGLTSCFRTDIAVRVH